MGIHELSPEDVGRLEDVLEWWRNTADADAQRTVPKATEYGAYDLEVIGATLMRLMGWENEPARVGSELGVFFYLLGKVARMASAYADHRLPSDDTLFDATVYSMMMRRIREAGEWG